MTSSSPMTSTASSDIVSNTALLPALRELAEAGGSAERVSQQLFQVVLQEFEPLVARRDFRSGALTKGELRHRSSLKREDAERLADEYLAESLLDVQCGGSTEVRVESHTLGKTELHAVCIPVVELHSGESEGGIGLLIDGPKDAAVAVAQRLTTLVTVASSLSAGYSTGQRQDSAGDNESARQLHSLARASQFSSVREFAYTLVNSLSSKFLCEQAAFGLAGKQRVEVLAVSGLAEIKASSPGVLAVRQAMEECVDQRSVVGWQQESPSAMASGETDDAIAPGLLHRQWAHESTDSSVISVPLFADDEIIAVVSLRRNSRHPFTSCERLQLDRLCKQFAIPIRLIETASRPITRQITAAIGGFAKQSLRRGAWGRWLALLIFMSGTGWFSMGTTQFHPRCTSHVAPETTLHFTAPFQARLEKVHVNSGDQVKAGQLLAEFDARDLRLEFESLAADLTAREVDVRTALQENDVEKAALYQAQADVMRTRALAVENRLRRARVIAPTDARIIQCDAKELTGQVLAQGDPVLQLAPHGGLVLKLQVPDGIATSVEPGQIGTFASTARPDLPLQFRIRQMNSAAEVVAGANVFVAEAEVLNPPDWLKVGMQGTVKIDSSIRPVWWVTAHSAIDWLRMRFWL